jgi:hypothetical protein
MRAMISNAFHTARKKEPMFMYRAERSSRPHGQLQTQ